MNADPIPHIHRAIRLSRINGFNHVTVVGPQGALVPDATFYLHRMRLRSEKHRVNTAFHLALVEDWRAACEGFESILAGRTASPGLVELLRDHLGSRAPRTMRLALKAVEDDPEFDPRETVSDTELYTRLRRAGDYIRRCSQLHAASAANGEAIRTAGAETADDIESMLPATEDVPRRGIPPDGRSMWWSVATPGSILNPLNPLQQQTLYVADRMCEEVGERANEPLLSWIDDLSPLGSEPLLELIDRRNDPRDPRADRPTLKLMPRKIALTEDLHKLIWHYVDEVRPRILAIAINSGNEERRREAHSNRHILISSHGRPLSKSMLAEMNRRVRMIEGLDPAMVRAQWRNAFADDWYECFGQTGRRNEIGHLMGRRRHSKQFERYPQGAVERQAKRTLIELAEWRAHQRSER